MCSQRVVFPVNLVVCVPRRGAQDGTLDAAVDHRDLKLRPCPHSFGVSSSPQHGSGTAPPGVSPATLAQRTRTRYTSLSFEQTLCRTRKPRKEEFQRRKSQEDKRQRQERGKKGQAGSSGAARSSTGKTFDEILKDSTVRTFMTATHQSGKVCWHFQRWTCTRDCKRLHECAGCSTAGIGYDACRCQASRV